MNVASRSLHIFVLGILLKSLIVHSIRFTAVTDIDRRYLNKLYIQEWNKDPPSELDPATSDPSVRQQICEEISNSGFLGELGRKPVSIQEIYPQLNETTYNDDHFHRIYRRTDSTLFEYVNPYTLEDFAIRTDVPTNKPEYAFVCLVKQNGSEETSKTDGSGYEMSSEFEDDTSSEGEGVGYYNNFDENEFQFHTQDLNGNIEVDVMTEMNDSDEHESANANGTHPSSGNETHPDREEDSMNASLREGGDMNDDSLYATPVELDSDNWDANDSTSGDGGTYTTISSEPEHSDDDADDSIYSVVPLYVSKAYYLNHGPHVHRFLFWKEDKFHRVMLAEGSAQVYTRPDFNVELHYLELRKHHNPVAPTTPEHDPVCRLNVGGLENSQLFRLCAIVLTASSFKDTVEYVVRLYFEHWSYSQITFRTPEARESAAGDTYRELTLECHARMIGGGTKIFHVSRAYNPNEVFVYSETSSLSTLGVYLENLVTNVHIVDEPHYFGKVEI